AAGGGRAGGREGKRGRGWRRQRTEEGEAEGPPARLGRPEHAGQQRPRGRTAHQAARPQGVGAVTREDDDLAPEPAAPARAKKKPLLALRARVCRSARGLHHINADVGLRHDATAGGSRPATAAGGEAMDRKDVPTETDSGQVSYPTPDEREVNHEGMREAEQPNRAGEKDVGGKPRPGASPGGGGEGGRGRG